MRTVIFILFSHFFSGQFIYGQDITKEEIYQKWTTSSEVLNQEQILSEIKNKDIDSVFKDFAKKNVDTFTFFKIASIGTIKKNTLPKYKCYLFWQSKGDFFVQKFTNKLTSQAILLPESRLMSFFIKNHNELEREFIMPPIYSAKMADEKIQYEGSIEFHDYNYTIFCQLGKAKKSIQFGQSYINDDKSLFYLDNISTFSFHWLKIAEAEIKSLSSSFLND